jgi:hypothetical protein
MYTIGSKISLRARPTSLGPLQTWTGSLGSVWGMWAHLFRERAGFSVQYITRPMPAGWIGQKNWLWRVCVQVYWRSTVPISQDAWNYGLNPEHGLTLSQVVRVDSLTPLTCAFPPNLELVRVQVRVRVWVRVWVENSSCDLGSEVTTLVQSRPLPSNAMRDWA